MLRTYFQQNEDWFANSGHPFSRFGEMESEIAELKTISKVTRLRKQIECREEGAWMIVKDVPDENAPNGSRKVTTYGRTRRSVTRSVTSNSDFDNIFHESMSNEPLVQHPNEENDNKTSKPSSVEITEVFEEPLRGNIIEIEKPDHQKAPERAKKKTSVVTLGEGNLVLIDPEKESNFHITGVSKGKVADAINNLEKTSEKKPKKVGFCKTEVHFAPDSGKINIVETDEKPPPTQVYRRKKRPRSSRRSSNSNCLPKHYFGEHDLDDSNQSNESDKEETRPHSFPSNIEPIPQVKQIFPAFERTIKSEGKDAKYRHSSPEKSNADFGFDKQFDEKEFFKKLKQPSFRERFLRENESPSHKLISSAYTTPNHAASFSDNKHETETSSFKGTNTTVNGLISRNKQFSKDKLATFSKNEYDITEEPKKPELRFTELFKFPTKNESDEDISPKNNINIRHDTDVPFKNEDLDQPKYAGLSISKSLVEDKDDFYTSVPRVPIDQDVKPDPTFLGSMSPKLKSLIQNSVEHEFQLRQKQILQRRTLERKSSGKDSNKIKSSVNIRVSPDVTEKVRETVPPEESKQKPTKLVTHFNAHDESTKHEFQLKREEITKKMFTEPLYSNKKEMPYLLNEEPIPAPREKTKNVVPPKPKPRTVMSPDRPKSKVSPRNPTPRHSNKLETSTLSKRARSRESLVKSKEPDKSCSKTTQNRDETKTKRIVPIKIEGGLQRLTKTNVQQRKVSRGEPLRCFEKVSNGWVGVVPPSTKREEKEASKVTGTSKAFSHKVLAQQSSHHSSDVRKSTQSGTLRSGRSDGKGQKQFSLSREHLSSAKLVKEISPRRPTARVRPEVRVVQAKETSYGRLRRDSNDSVIQADEEVRAYMFRSPPKEAVKYFAPGSMKRERPSYAPTCIYPNLQIEMSGGEMDEMTASYTEICEGAEGLPGGNEQGRAEAPAGERPNQLELLNRLDGTVATEEGASGKMITFVADDLETKLRLASPRGILAALESEACALAASVDSLTESLADALHGISAMTVECLETYTSVVTKTSDAIDANIKAMYQLMAKSEELSKAMAPLYKLSGHIKNIKHLLDLIEASPS